MQLRRIEIRDFRKIQHRVVEGLDDGLNVLVGDNEAGKSTLLAALRAVFFERHTLGGKPIEAMMPYGATVRPEISADFTIAGGLWRLRKAFAQRPEAELSGPGGVRLTGPAVEDRLAELLGFTPPGRGASKPDEHHGTHGLLWVEQGTRESLGVGAGRDTLATALEREVGQVTGGDRGRALLAAAAERRDRVWTKTDKPRGEWRELRDEVEALEGERDGLRKREQLIEARITRLAEVKAILARHTRDDRLKRATAASAVARQAVADVAARSAALAEAERRHGEAARDHAAAAERKSRRDALVLELGRADGTARLTERSWLDSEMVSRHRDAQARSAEATLRAALAREAEARTAVRLIEDALRQRDARLALDRQTELLRRAEAEDERRRAATVRADMRPVDKGTVAKLQELDKAAEALRSDLRAASVEIGFEPESGGDVLVDGGPHPAGTPLRLARDATLMLAGFGRVTVRPGGGTASLLRRAEAAETALRQALDRAGFSSTGEAQRALEARTEALAEAAAVTKAVQALAPQGLDSLRQTVDTERARLSRLGGDAESALAAIETPDRARQAEAEARAAVAAAEAEMKTTARAREDARLDEARQAERLAAAKNQQGALVASLERARTEASDDLLAERLAGAERDLGGAAALVGSAKAALEAADPENARLTLQRLERAEREIAADLDTLERERRDIQAELRGGGQEGLGERIAEIEGVLDVRRKRLATVTIEAEAAKLLHETLLEAQSDSKDRWLQPVRARVSPYLKLMAPGTDIDVDEHTLELRGLLRNGLTEPFEALSMGAREQIAVVTRLALADVLRAAGHPAVVILDDALVNTDETRLERMHNVLTRAATNLQILILTCRERDFLGLGKTHRV